jgi:DNA/RNA-binding domain of Phe-tRNA-synthetase-like protein
MTMGPSGKSPVPELTVADELDRKVIAGQLWAGPVAVAPASPSLANEIEEYGAALRSELAGRSPAQIPGLRPAREFYRLFGIDPTKTRPSSEALLRRVLREKPLPRISNAVDLGNYMALRFLLPLGLYDSEKIQGRVRLDAGTAGQSYVGVRKDEVHLGGRPVLCDDRGPFGNPTADSLRTAVCESSRVLWMVVFAPRSVTLAEMRSNLVLAAQTMQRHLAAPGSRVETEIRLTPA